ncbi:MAG: aldo/keto reductase [Microbacteriaceae bacterium]|nr:aldo/keto reductase [Microbacteriaceae bacterium]
METMDHTTLGRTGLDVSVACLGTGGHSMLGQAYGKTFDESVAVVNAAIDAGVTFIDTAFAYGTEEIVGKAIAGRRDDLVISTKNHIVKKGTSFLGDDFITGAEFIALVEDSLRRLGTEHVDILHLHGVVASQYDYCVAEMVPALERLREQGKIGSTAISERFYVEPEHDLLRRALQDDYFDVMMVGLNLVNHTALADIVPAANAKGVGLQGIYAVRGTLATSEGMRKLIDESVALGEIDPALLDADPVAFLTAPGAASSLVEACYRYNRWAPGVDTTLTGTGSVDHLRENLAALALPPLPDSVLARIDEVFGGVHTVTGE